LRTWTASYDAFDSPLNVSVSGPAGATQTFNYAYDNANNRTSEQSNGVQRLFYHDVLNQVTAASNIPPDTNAYQWDPAHRLVSITSQTHASEFSYDGFGRRIRIVEK